MVGKKGKDLRKQSAKAALSALLSDELAPLFWEAARPDSESAWFGHIPFAHWLIRQVQPRVLVELGTHTGVSYSALCSTVLREGLATRCFAVDTWKGDDHAGHYHDSVYEEFSRFNDEHYGAFSTLLRKTFDEALSDIDDKCVDLLHIDGFHSYDAVRHDFESWAPKLSDHAVVLFHDTNERRADFGVWQYWAELSKQYPAFEFLHSHGLGVLCVGKKAPDAVVSLCCLSEADTKRVRCGFEASGDRWMQRAGRRRLQEQVATVGAENENMYKKLAKQAALTEKLHHEKESASSALEDANNKLRLLGEELQDLTRVNTELDRERHKLEAIVKLSRKRTKAAEAQARQEWARDKALEDEKQDILRSASWRLTERLRAAVKLGGGRWGPALAGYFFRPKRAAHRETLPPELKTVASSHLFDREQYLRTYPDVAAAGLDPVIHYCEYGWRECRDPGPNFSTHKYMLSNPDVLDAGFNPLVHYERHGQFEGRKIFPSEISHTKTYPLPNDPKHKKKAELTKKIEIALSESNIEEIDDFLECNFNDLGESIEMATLRSYVSLKLERWNEAERNLSLIYNGEVSRDPDFELLCNGLLNCSSANDSHFRDISPGSSNYKPKICVYTSVFGSYDQLNPIFSKSKLVDEFICFTDQDITNTGWSINKSKGKLKTPLLSAKEYKVNPHKYLKNYDYSLFLDGNIIINGCIDKLIQNYLINSKFAMWRHPQRSDIMIELIAIALSHRHDPAPILEQIKSYVDSGFSCTEGIAEGNLIWRQHNDRQISRMMEAWWGDICKFSTRDQISLPFICWKYGIKPESLPNSLGNSRNSEFFSKINHRVPLETVVPQRKVGVIFLGWPNYEYSGSTVMRGKQLSEICNKGNFGRNIDFQIFTDFPAFRQKILFLTKNVVQNISTDNLDYLKKAGNILVMDPVDTHVHSEKLRFCDILIASSLSAYVAYLNDYPQLRVCHLTHHVDPRIPGGNKAKGFRAGYFGELVNTERGRKFSELVDFVDVSTSIAKDDWIEDLEGYNFHYAIRRKRDIDGYKPFLKGFTAAHCGANILVQEDANDAVKYLSRSYPYLIRPGPSENDILEMIEFARSTYNGPVWKAGLEIMREVRERSSPDVVLKEFGRIFDM